MFKFNFYNVYDNLFIRMLRNIQLLHTTPVLLLYRFQFRNASVCMGFLCNSLIDIL